MAWVIGGWRPIHLYNHNGEVWCGGDDDGARQATESLEICDCIECLNELRVFVGDLIAMTEHEMRKPGKERYDTPEEESTGEDEGPRAGAPGGADAQRRAR